jgi:hypothetical protein
MSGYEGYPPSGRGYPAPGNPYPPGGTTPSNPAAPPGYLPPPAMLGAAHKPGAIPLRPLRLGDLYDAAFKIIRFNPKATVGSSVIVASIAMLIPVIVTGILSVTIGLSLKHLDENGGQIQTAELAGLAGAYGALGLGSLMQWLGMIFVTGMNAHVAAAAAVGRRLSLGEAWAATRGKRWRLVGMMLLLLALSTAIISGLVGAIVVVSIVFDTLAAVLVSIMLAAVTMVAFTFVWVRIYYLAVPPLMLEPIGVFAALGRAWTLTRNQFWRTFGIALLTGVIANIAGGIISAPIGIIGQIVMAADPGGAGFFWFVVGNSFATVVASALVSPFITTVASLQYIDQRIRKEAYDVELMARAGFIAS